MRIALALAVSLMAGVASAPGAFAQGHEAVESPKQPWSFNGPFGTFDRASMQRGFQVYKEVCSNCHSMKEIYYRNLTSIGLNEEQVKAIAASVTVPGSVSIAARLPVVERPIPANTSAIRGREFAGDMGRR